MLPEIAPPNSNRIPDGTDGQGIIVQGIIVHIGSMVPALSPVIASGAR
jgi:hypothetical protein